MSNTKWVYLFNEVDQAEDYVGGEWELVRALLGGKGGLKYQTVGHSPYDLGKEAGLVEPDHHTDDELRNAMGFLFSRLKFAVEPACAASTAAALGPLREQLAGQRVVLVFCGSNIDWTTFASQARFER